MGPGVQRDHRAGGDQAGIQEGPGNDLGPARYEHGRHRNHPREHALGLVFGGEVLDTDANSDYGSVFEQFLAEFGSAIDRRTSVVVWGSKQWS